VSTVVQGYLLLFPSSRLSHRLFYAIIPWNFGAYFLFSLLGLVFPMTADVELLGEAELFFLQHICIGIVSPITLMLSDKFKPHQFSLSNLYFVS
jgi:hypothetical protein